MAISIFGYMFIYMAIYEIFHEHPSCMCYVVCRKKFQS